MAEEEGDGSVNQQCKLVLAVPQQYHSSIQEVMLWTAAIQNGSGIKYRDKHRANKN